MKLDNLDFNHIHINEESSDFNEICCVQMMFHIRKSKEILHFLVFYTDKIQEIIFEDKKLALSTAAEDKINKCRLFLD